ncbi:hypothetical protein OAP48_00485, partial [bacterium]|nr:hypothetical protein [bacterium]
MWYRDPKLRVARPIHPDHSRAKISQDHRAIGHRPNSGNLDNANSCKWAHRNEPQLLRENANARRVFSTKKKLMNTMM